MKVVNRHHEKGRWPPRCYYIGRPGRGGARSPGRYDPRESVHDAVLICSCKPRACHGDVIVRAWSASFRKRRRGSDRRPCPGPGVPRHRSRQVEPGGAGAGGGRRLPGDSRPEHGQRLGARRLDGDVGVIQPRHNANVWITVPFITRVPVRRLFMRALPTGHAPFFTLLGAEYWGLGTGSRDVAIDTRGRPSPQHLNQSPGRLP